MDRNSAIGLTLIAALLLGYFYFFSPTPPPPTPVTNQSITSQPSDTLKAASDVVKAANDSALINQYGKLATALSGEAVTEKVENEDLALTLSNNGTIETVELKKYKTYGGEPLVLIQPSHNSFALRTRIDGKDVDLYQLRYQPAIVKANDTTFVSYTVQMDGGASLRHTYSIPATGYKVGYRLEAKGLSLEGDNLIYAWRDNVPLVEKDIQNVRIKTTVNYYKANGDFEGISESALDPETESFADPVKWVAIRQKFFIASIIAGNKFNGGEVSTQANQTDSLHVKLASVKLFLSTADVNGTSGKYTYFFGPNDYHLLETVTTGFTENLDLGWPPVSWVNRYVILNVFNFLETFIGNYGIIIMILVLIIKLCLTPLSYKSYLGMAKMKLLKPELDLIKEKNGDNMAQTQQDQMKLYQQAGVNPFSGCIPLLLQLPIMLAMFYFFPVSIQLRQAKFLWAEDLSTYDSVLNLPFTIPFYGDHVSLFVLLMTASTLVYTWQNNQITSVQGPMKSMSLLMPVVFMFVLNSFSAGLSFYYFVSNLVTFTQQAIIRRFVDDSKIKAVMDDHKKKMQETGGTGKKSNFMSRLEGAMKASEEARKASDEAKKRSPKK